VVATNQGEHERALALYEQCARVWQEIGDSYSLAHQLTNIGDVASLLGQIERARDCFRRGLILRRDLEDRDGVRWTLHSLAFLARQIGDGEGAVRLLGAAAPLGDQLGAMLGTQRQALYDQNEAALREQLGEAAYAAAWAEGQCMDYRQAISYALDR